MIRIQKYYIYLLPILLHVNSAVAQVQSPPEYDGPVNYVATWNATAPETDESNLTLRPLADVKKSTQYLDGLGRPIQTVIREGTRFMGQNADLVDITIYDQFGREKYKYLPFASHKYVNGTVTGININGAFDANPAPAQVNFYNQLLVGQVGETNVAPNNLNWAYSQKNYEASPADKVQEQYAPGVSWVGSSDYADPQQRRSIKGKFWFNTKVDNVRIWNIANNPTTGAFATFISSDYYLEGLLTKSATEDEQGKQVIEFKDKEGNIILKKVQNTASPDDGLGRGHAGWLCTYYIYDELNRLRCVVQPKLVERMDAGIYWEIPNDDLAKELCFRYEYDYRNRMIVKQVPGAAPVYMVYDKWDRLVMLQDGNLRSNKKWLVTQYDDLNRPKETGLWKSLTLLLIHLQNASLSTSYPVMTSADYELLTETHYDDYSGMSGLAVDGVFNSLWEGDFLQDYGNWPYPERQIQSLAVRGMVTWTKTAVLNNPTRFVYAVNIYDHKSRVIQVKSTSFPSGTNYITNQYSWDGKPLKTIQYQEPGLQAATQKNTIYTTNTYDELGRLTEVHKRVRVAQNNKETDVERRIVLNEYDELGRLKNKKMSPDNNLEDLTYEYNVRGWLLGTNRQFTQTTSTSAHYFGFDLGYDKTLNGLIDANSYNTPYFNGNIAGTVWKTSGDAKIRKYDFSYDPANRLTAAAFTQYNPANSIFDLSANVNFSVQNLNYDANGNIRTMQQHGLQLTGSSMIDNLEYFYQTNAEMSNKLASVSELTLGNTNNHLGDFTDLNSGQDYDYDDNGNLKYDKNKNIGSISYNHLNLPAVVKVTGKGEITYTYDAAGNKLKKQTVEDAAQVTHNNITYTTSVTSTTHYMDGLVFESKSYGELALASLNYTGVLQFIPHEEGRIRFIETDAEHGGEPWLRFDYFLKDHLGNVRVVLTDEEMVHAYPPASLENSTLAQEQQFYNIPTGIGVRVDWHDITDYPSNDNYTAPNDWVQVLNGSGTRIGSSMTLKVMAGDRFNVSASHWYYKPPGPVQPPVNILPQLVAALNSSIGSLPGAHASAAQLTSSNVLQLPVQEFLASQPDVTGDSRPRAYLNWILFDEQFKLVASCSGAEQVSYVNDYGVSPNNQVKRIVRTDMPITVNGYLYIYVSNETPGQDVVFDNLHVTHVAGKLLEETHYYPFGLTMAGISIKAGGVLQNKNKFNGGNELQEFEFSGGIGLAMYDAVNRMYDPQIGRFWQIDELAEGNWECSPYHFVLNNPLRFNDPLGLQEGDPEKPVVTRASYLNNVTVTGTYPTLTHNELQYWYWKLRKANKGYNVPNRPKLSQRLERWDKVQRFMDKVHDGVREDGYVILEVGSWFIPMGWLTKAKYLKQAVSLLKLKRGRALLNVGAHIVDDATRGVVHATGQAHHLLSNKIVTALEKHPLLKGAFAREDTRFIYNALDGAAHKGYQTWHRQYDKMVVDYIQANPQLTPSQFQSYLHDLYQQSWLQQRIPNVNLNWY